MTQFNSLPAELQITVFASAVERQSRVVEIGERNGVIISKTPPPPLLHPNCLARTVVLKLWCL